MLTTGLQRFLQITTCLFYGADCSRPCLVPVPVRDGVHRAPTLDDLDVTYWVKQYEHGQCTVSRRILRCSFDSAPCSGLYIAGRYTIFLELPSVSSRPNRLLARMSNTSRGRESVTGSILVVKQRSDGSIVDMMNCDQNTSNFLISRYVTSSSI